MLGCQGIVRVWQEEQQQHHPELCVKDVPVLAACTSVTEASLAQDASVKVRRAAFALWLQLHGLPDAATCFSGAHRCRHDKENICTPLYNSCTSDALQVLKQRAQDRYGKRQLCHSCFILSQHFNSPDGPPTGPQSGHP